MLAIRDYLYCDYPNQLNHSTAEVILPSQRYMTVPYQGTAPANILINLVDWPQTPFLKQLHHHPYFILSLVLGQATLSSKVSNKKVKRPNKYQGRSFGSSAVYLLDGGLPDHEQLPDDAEEAIVEADDGGGEPEAADDPADEGILHDDDHSDHVEPHVQHQEHHQEEDVLCLQFLMQFGTGRASTGGLHPQMPQLAFADLAAERLLHAPAFGCRGRPEAMRQVLLQAESVHELDGPAAVAGSDEAVGVSGLQTDAALLGLPTGQQRPISHINKFQPVPPRPTPPPQLTPVQLSSPPSLPLSVGFPAIGLPLQYL